tara:strand:+ start:2133 stop:2273 length:141 start_codon:yes stop_codon:yes gene_type:complete
MNENVKSKKEMLEKRVKELQNIRETLVLCLNFIDRVEEQHKKEKPS